ncbi:hypothetical protein F53441_7369 [Fusarium austroafricanum]|uniref:Uncharacterized protein n=1 Tax=Fusarium austroafricanum TaxID=2364996 RepID=A0A8H4KFV8_9HYPO|nr:hypothetical protein F53441_7369 [Fusarium austroafricanum]
MKFSISMISAAAILSPLVAANFDLYFQSPTSSIGGLAVWQAVDDTASTDDCVKMTGTRTFEQKPDVSGDKDGFRCKGTGCYFGGDVNGIEELEMNFGTKGNDVYHFTIYQRFREDNKWWMVGLDNKVYGWCSPWTEKSYNCPAMKGQQKFMCNIEGLSAQDITNDLEGEGWW